MSSKDPIKTCRVDPKTFDLKKVDPQDHPGMKDKASAALATAANLEAIANWQYRLYAENKQALLIVLQGIDAAGKDGTIRKVFSVLNPQGTRVRSFKQPTEEEREHDFLWRIHRNTPRHGEVGIFNRSHYEDVLVVRVHDLVPKKVWKSRYTQINQFEKLLSSSGTKVLKFFLYISPEEQKERFQERLDNPEKQWKFSTGDIEQRKYWDDYVDAFQDVLVNCSTPTAPWYVIPANRKWYRNWIISEITKKAFEEMNPQIPPPEPGLDQIVL
ncbi:polyphosphate kinase 2 family protein [Kiritimatiellota bacterium B12222]|nr:polyphosphate kinase 2 family protein [Kiritimatiellota bacterium B12222]